MCPRRRFKGGWLIVLRQACNNAAPPLEKHVFGMFTGTRVEWKAFISCFHITKTNSILTTHNPSNEWNLRMEERREKEWIDSLYLPSKKERRKNSVWASDTWKKVSVCTITLRQHIVVIDDMGKWALLNDNLRTNSVLNEWLIRV